MVLDAQDEQFEQFAIWQDANTDGISDANEIKSLAEHSIKSIDLSYQEGSESRITADGDVEVFGQLTVRYEDGTTGLAEDTAFKTSIIQAGEAERSKSEELNADENANAEADTPLWLLEAIDELGSEQLNELKHPEQNSQQQIEMFGEQ